MGVLTGKTDEQEHIEWDELRARAAIEAPLRKRIAELEAAIRDLKREHEAPVADYALRRALRDKLFAMISAA